MFTLLRDLGVHVKEAEGVSELEQLSEPMGEEYVHGLTICFDRSGGFKGVYRTEGQEGIIYKFGSPRGNDYTLVSKTSPKIENVVPRLNRNAQKIVDWGEADDDTINLIEACLETAEEDEEAIIEEVLEAYPEDASRDQRVFAYWALIDDGDIRPFCETETLEEYLAAAVFESYAERSSANVEMMDPAGTCAVCGTSETTVYGNFSDIACYNIDKQGFITGGFSYAQTTDNFPVCRSCILAVRGGLEYVEEHLDSYMAGLNYWLLPEARDDDVYKALLRAIEDRERQSLGQEAASLTGREEAVLDYISDVLEDEGGHDPATLNLFFYESSRGAWRIVGEMRRVLPSRVKQLMDTKEDLESLSDLHLSEADAGGGYRFNIPKLRPFCGSLESQDDRKLIRYLEAIFQGEPVRESTLVSDLVRGILDAHKDALGKGGVGGARYTVRDAWATYLFLDRIGSIDHKQEGDAVTTFQEDNAYTRYIDDNDEFFRDSQRTVAFLTGCYVGQVMYAQYLENPDRGSQPFAKKFVGRKLDRDRLEKLYNEGKEKLTHYEREGLVRDLDPVLADAWVQVGNGWTLSPEKTTLAFNLGWTLSRKLAVPDEDDEETVAPEAAT
jgi:CRISPR-associated protein Csh1